MKTLLLTLALALAVGATAGPIEGAFGWRFGERLDTKGMEADATGRKWTTDKPPDNIPPWEFWWVVCDRDGKVTEIRAAATLPTLQERTELETRCIRELRKRHGDTERQRSAVSRALDYPGTTSLDFRSVRVRVIQLQSLVGYGLAVVFEAVQEIKDSELPVLPTLGGH